MRITLIIFFDIFPQEWHNHELLNPSEVLFLLANRKITKENEERILLLKGGGFSVRQI